MDLFVVYVCLCHALVSVSCGPVVACWGKGLDTWLSSV